MCVQAKLLHTLCVSRCECFGIEGDAASVFIYGGEGTVGEKEGENPEACKR